jgi:hypothetical protein
MIKMPCPYLSTHSKKRCVEMEKAGRHSEISEFDFKHYCNGNPTLCYYHRKAQRKRAHTNK